MKFIYILTWITCFGIFTSAEAQISTSDSATADAGELNTLFNTPVESVRYGGCSLVQNDEKDREIYTYKNGYKIVTEEDDEVVEVRNKKDGDKKLKYHNGYESLKYHLKRDGRFHYNYSYYNECKKVKVRRNKDGIISVTNKSGEVDAEEIRKNVQAAIKKGANTCAAAAYSR